MVTRHFFKLLAIFTAMIALGLAGVFWVNSVAEKEAPTATAGCAEETC